MSNAVLKLPLALLLALGAVTGASAQGRGKHDQTVLPVWNNASGKLEALLVLEPADGAQVGTRWRFGNNSLDTTFGLEQGDSLALFCNRKNGIGAALGNLSNNCMLATLGDGLVDGGSHRTSINTSINRNGGKLGLSLGNGHDTLPVWLTPGATASSKVDVNDLAVFGQKHLGRQGFVSIAGTVAKARLASPSEFPGLTDRWTTKAVSVGGGFGAFGANLVGHVVDSPGQPKWEGLGLGLTWRTPWSGQLSVGADNVITRGKNPFAPSADSAEEGTVPYVRYEQDL